MGGHDGPGGLSRNNKRARRTRNKRVLLIPTTLRADERGAETEILSDG